MKDSYIFYKDKLSQEYLTVFEQIEMYVLSQNIDDSTSEERLGELLDIFFSAEQSGKPVQKITGNNLEQFCRAFCSDFGIKNRILRILDFFRSIAWLFVSVSVLDIVFFLLDSETVSEANIWSSISSLNLSGYIIGIAIACALVMISNVVLRHFMFRTKQISMKLLRAASCVIAIFLFLLIFLLMSLSSTNLFECPVWILLTLSGIYLILYYIFCGKRNKRQKISFWDLVNEEAHKGFAEEMEKKFAKANRRNIKKGKGELSLEAFLDREEKDCNQTEKLNWLYYIFPVFFIVCAYLWAFTTGNIETFTDSIIFIAILSAVEYPLMLSFRKITQTGVTERREWIKAKREELNKDES